MLNYRNSLALNLMFVILLLAACGQNDDGGEATNQSMQSSPTPGSTMTETSTPSDTSEGQESSEPTPETASESTSTPTETETGEETTATAVPTEQAEMTETEVAEPAVRPEYDPEQLPGTELVPEGMEPITFPPVEIDPDEMEELAIEHLKQRDAVLEGEPEVVYSGPTTQPHLQDVGLSAINYSNACLRPMYLVVLNGEFDERSLTVGGNAADDPRRATHAGVIFDLANGAPGMVTTTLVSPDGSLFKELLEDPSLPDPGVPYGTEPEPPYIPCEGDTSG